MPCAGCGRTFKEESLAAHTKGCRKYSESTANHAKTMGSPGGRGLSKGLGGKDSGEGAGGLS